MATILFETRGIAHNSWYHPFWSLSTDPNLPYWARILDQNSGVDKGTFTLLWIEENRSRLTSQEIRDLEYFSNFVIDWYRANTQ